jgi:hypothetical protein
MRWIGRLARSGDDGLVVIPYVDAPGGISCRLVEVELGPHRRWIEALAWPTGRKDRVVVRHAPIHGHVEGPEPQRLSVASIASLDPWPEPPNRPSPLQLARTFPQRIDAEAWTPVASDGSFIVSDGWQGSEANYIVARDDATGAIVAVEHAAPGAFVRVQGPERCELTCRVTTASNAVDSPTTLQLMGHRSPTYWLEEFPNYTPETFPKHMNVSRGFYGVQETIGRGNPCPLANVDCSGPAAELHLAIGPRYHVHGTVVGEMGGARANIQLVFLDASGRSAGVVRTSPSGAFDTVVSGAPPIAIRAWWPLPNGGTQSSSDPIASVREAETMLRYVRPEGKLVLKVVGNPILAPRSRIVVSKLDEESGEIEDEILEMPAGTSRTVELCVSPGTYRVTQQKGYFRDGEAFFARNVTVDRGAVAPLDVSPRPTGLVRIHVKNVRRVDSQETLLVEGVEAASLTLSSSEPETVEELVLPAGSFHLRLGSGDTEDAARDEALGDSKINRSILAALAVVKDGESCDAFFELR